MRVIAREYASKYAVCSRASWMLIRVLDITSLLSFISNCFNLSCILFCSLCTLSRSLYFNFLHFVWVCLPWLVGCFGIHKFIFLTAHSRRGDLEILGYNMTHWLCSRLPWEDKLQDCNYVFGQKRAFMENIPSLISQCFPETEPPGKFSLLLKLKHSSSIVKIETPGNVVISLVAYGIVAVV